LLEAARRWNSQLIERSAQCQQGGQQITKLVHGFSRIDYSQRYCAVFDVPEGADDVFPLAEQLSGPGICWHASQGPETGIPDEVKGRLLTQAEFYQAVPERDPARRRSRKGRRSSSAASR
jgi:hypothetical protein